MCSVLFRSVYQTGLALKNLQADPDGAIKQTPSHLNPRNTRAEILKTGCKVFGFRVLGFWASESAITA